MTTPVSVDNAEHYTWGTGCDGWHLLADENLSVIEEQMPPGAREQPHAHARARQFFFVLEGRATMNLSGELVQIEARCGLSVPPGVRHQMMNTSSADVRFLVVSSPKSHGDRVPVELAATSPVDLSP